MLFLDLENDLNISFHEFADPIFDFFKNLWNEFYETLTYFMPKMAANILIFALVTFIILIIVNAVISRK